MFDPHPACRKKSRQGEAGLGSATLYLGDAPGSKSATPRPALLLAGPILRAVGGPVPVGWCMEPADLYIQLGQLVAEMPQFDGTG